jgi:hypothetical protein
VVDDFFSVFSATQILRFWGHPGVNTMLMMLGVAKPIFRLPYTFVPRCG